MSSIMIMPWLQIVQMQSYNFVIQFFITTWVLVMAYLYFIATFMKLHHMHETTFLNSWSFKVFIWFLVEIQCHMLYPDK